MEKKIQYYQFQKELGYQVFIRFEDEEFESQYVDILMTLGFSKIKDEELKSITFDKNETKILKVQEATPRVAKQIYQSHAMEKYGNEHLTPKGSYEVYGYKGVAMMVFGEGNYFWELGLIGNQADDNAAKTVFVRYIGWALASQGVLSFWGVPVDEGIVVMKPIESNFENILIDINKNIFISKDGIKPIGAGAQILRLDEMLKDRTRRMSKEALVSFLSMNSSYLSYQGIPFSLKQSILRLVDIVDGYIYPIENFQPRADVQEGI